MHHPDRTKAAAQRAALLFFVAGLLAVLNSFRVASGQLQTPFIALGVGDLVIAVLLWLLPWERWHTQALWLVIPVAFVMIGLFEVVGAQTPYTYPIFFILIFIWVGLSMPPRTALLLTPLTVIAYILPLLSVGAPRPVVESVFVAVPVCVLVGEVIAHAVGQFHAAKNALEQRVIERTTQLQSANAALQRELSEREQLQAQFLQAQKLEGIGQLAGGIAHDFNNLLTAISGYADLMWDALPSDQPMRSALSIEGVDLAGASAHLNKAAALCAAQQDPTILAQTTFELGSIAAQQGDLAGAIELYRRALAVGEAHAAAAQYRILAHNNLAYHLLLLGDPTALAHAKAGLEIAREGGMLGFEPYLLSTLGEIALANDDLDSAEASFNEGLELAERLPIPERVAGLTANLALVSIKRGQTALAIHRLSTALARADALGTRHLAAQIRIWLAPLLPPAEAHATLAEARALAESGNRTRLLEQIDRLERRD